MTAVTEQRVPGSDWIPWNQDFIPLGVCVTLPAQRPLVADPHYGAFLKKLVLIFFFSLRYSTICWLGKVSTILPLLPQFS